MMCSFSASTKIVFLKNAAIQSGINTTIINDNDDSTCLKLTVTSNRENIIKLEYVTPIKNITEATMMLKGSVNLCNDNVVVMTRVNITDYGNELLMKCSPILREIQNNLCIIRGTCPIIGMDNLKVIKIRFKSSNTVIGKSWNICEIHVIYPYNP